MPFVNVRVVKGVFSHSLRGSRSASDARDTGFLVE